MATAQPYQVRVLTELDGLAVDFEQLLGVSAIKENHWPDGFVGLPSFSWHESSPTAQQARMALLAKVQDLEPRFRLLFPHPTPEVQRVMKESSGLLRQWTTRGRNNHPIPRSIEQAKEKTTAAVNDLKALTAMLATDSWSTRVVVDSNTLLDNPDLAAYTPVLGARYMVHVMPLVLGELDDLKRSGRNPEVRAAAQRAGRTLAPTDSPPSRWSSARSA